MLLDKRSEVNNTEDNRKSIISHFLGETLLNISNLIADDNYVKYLPSKRTRYCFGIGIMYSFKEEEIK